MNETKKIVGVVALVAVMGVAIYAAKNSRDGAIGRFPAANWQLWGVPGQQEVMDEITEVVINTPTRDHVLNTVEKIQAIVQREAPRNMPMVKLAGDIASLVPLLEGVIWRLRPIVEPSDWLHGTILFSIRTTYYNDYLYGPHVKALLDFMTEPSRRVGPEFKNVTAAQDWIMTTLVPALEGFLARFPAEYESKDMERFEFEIDRTLLVGRGNDLTLVDPSEAKKVFIKPYLYTFKFLVERAVMGLVYVSSIHLDDLPRVANAVLRTTGINAVKSGFNGHFLDGRMIAKGVTPEIVFEEILKEGAFPNFLMYRRQIKYKDERGERVIGTQEALNKAFEFGKRSAVNQLRGYVCGLTYPSERRRGRPRVDDEYCRQNPLFVEGQTFIEHGNNYLFDPNLMMNDFKAKHNAFNRRAFLYEKNATGQPATIHSDVTGKDISLNAKEAFFTAGEGKDPRFLLPTDFEHVEAWIKPARIVRDTHAWNYHHGRPSTYRNFTMNGFFAGSDQNSLPALRKNMTTLMYTPAVAPFAAFVRFPSPVRLFIPVTDIVNAN